MKDDILEELRDDEKNTNRKSSANTFALIFGVILFILNIVMIILTVKAKRSKQSVERSTSFSCPVYSCAYSDTDLANTSDLNVALSDTPLGSSRKITNPTQNCDMAPFRFETNSDGSLTKICMEYTTNQAGVQITKVNQN